MEKCPWKSQQCPIVCSPGSLKLTVGHCRLRWVRLPAVSHKFWLVLPSFCGTLQRFLLANSKCFLCVSLLFHQKKESFICSQVRLHLAEMHPKVAREIPLNFHSSAVATKHLQDVSRLFCWPKKLLFYYFSFAFFVQFYLCCVFFFVIHFLDGWKWLMWVCWCVVSGMWADMEGEGCAMSANCSLTLPHTIFRSLTAVTTKSHGTLQKQHTNKKYIQFYAKKLREKREKEILATNIVAKYLKELLRRLLRRASSLFEAADRADDWFKKND